jgi:hypothetical protein
MARRLAALRHIRSGSPATNRGQRIRHVPARVERPV